MMSLFKTSTTAFPTPIVPFIPKLLLIKQGEEFGFHQVNLPGDNTDNPMWWQDHIPLWTTAVQAGEDIARLPSILHKRFK